MFKRWFLLGFVLAATALGFMGSTWAFFEALDYLLRHSFDLGGILSMFLMAFAMCFSVGIVVYCVRKMFYFRAQERG